MSIIVAQFMKRGTTIADGESEYGNALPKPPW